jgi:hypothetical protein
MRVADVQEKYAEQAAARAYERIYEDDAQLGHVFAVLHDKLNRHFMDINDRAKSTHHYWADNSRALFALIDEIRQDVQELSRAGINVELAESYERALEDAETWLSRSGGSPVPDDYKPLEIVRYEPILTTANSTVSLKKESSPVKRKMVGSGSYAHVYSYVDPDYDIPFAVKAAKKGINARDQYRFRQEFDVMKGLDFPYVVQVYQFDELRNEYKMEYCDATLREYVSSRNGNLPFGSRKRIALRFLYGLNYIHGKGLLHREGLLHG